MQGFVPGFFELATRRFAFDDQQRFAGVVADQNIGTATAGAVTQLPRGFEFDVLGLVAFFEQAMDAFENDEISLKLKLQVVSLLTVSPAG